MRSLVPAIATLALGAFVLAGQAAPALAGSLTTRVTPNPTAPGTITTFDVFCGSTATSATLFGITIGLSPEIAMHSTASTQAGEFVVTVTMPTSIFPGVYRPSIDCSNGRSTNARFRVNPVPGQGAQTGDGTTATAKDTPLTWLGAGLAAAGLATGGLALRRRRRA